MPSCTKVSPRSRFTPLPGAALGISLGTIVSQPSAVQQEQERGQSLAMHAQLHEGLTSLAFYCIARGYSGDFARHHSVSASAVQQEQERGSPLAMHAQLQEGLTSLAFYSLARGCSGDFARHHSVLALCSTARTGAGLATVLALCSTTRTGVGAVTSYACPVAR